MSVTVSVHTLHSVWVLHCVLMSRHIDHSVGLVAAAEDISKARSTQTRAGSSSGSQNPSTAPQAAAPAPVSFDLHPGRPYRRGLQLPHIVPFNLVSHVSSLVGSFP